MARKVRAAFDNLENTESLRIRIPEKKILRFNAVLIPKKTRRKMRKLVDFCETMFV